MPTSTVTGPRQVPHKPGHQSPGLSGCGSPQLSHGYHEIKSYQSNNPITAIIIIIRPETGSGGEIVSKQSYNLPRGLKVKVMLLHLL